MAKGHLNQYLNKEEVSLKKYFYTLRALLSCQWIAQHSTPPPLLFNELISAYLPTHLQELVAQLLERKRTTRELGQGKPIEAINFFIMESIEKAETWASQASVPENKDGARLEDLFLKIVKNNA